VRWEFEDLFEGEMTFSYKKHPKIIKTIRGIGNKKEIYFRLLILLGHKIATLIRAR
jgi:hypothetical protein